MKSNLKSEPPPLASNFNTLLAIRKFAQCSHYVFDYTMDMESILARHAPHPQTLQKNNIKNELTPLFSGKQSFL
jgi:hypothetical protein